MTGNLEQFSCQTKLRLIGIRKESVPNSLLKDAFDVERGYAGERSVEQQLHDQV